MATQGVLSIVHSGQVILKAIVGSDGYEMPAIAAEVKRRGKITAQELLELCHDHDLGGESLVVQMSPTEWIGECADEELPPLYAEKFNDPRFNPRWARGYADFVEIVEIKGENFITEHQLYESSDFKDEQYERPGSLARLVIDGGMAICKVCGGAEGSLPTTCPGFRLSWAQEEAIYKGRLDFTEDGWKGEQP